MLADIKTFEAHRVVGLGVTTAITYQNDVEFTGLHWLLDSQVENQISILEKRFYFDVAKIGLVKDLDSVSEIVKQLKKANPNIKIIWDPILKASAGYEFHSNWNLESILSLLTEIDLIVPNALEINTLLPQLAPTEAACLLSRHCDVLLKGGHLDGQNVSDTLFEKGVMSHSINNERIPRNEKRGTGCVLSSAIASNLHLGFNVIEACEKAVKYVRQYIVSSDTRLGFHKADHSMIPV